MLDEGGSFAEIVEGRIANIFCIFSQAENHVKEMVAERTVLHSKDTLALAEIHLLTYLHRSFERAETHDAYTPNNHAEIH